MIPNLQPILENGVWMLDPLRENDFDALYAAAADPTIWVNHPTPTRWQRDVFSTFFEGAIQSGGAFKIVEKASKKVIGSTRFYNYIPEKNSILIGYTFYATQYWGTGANRAVKEMMLDYIFQFVNVVYFHVGAQNVPSIKAMTKLGAENLGKQEVVYFGEGSRMNVVFRMMKSDWLEKV